jgi:hypothetical protein
VFPWNLISRTCFCSVTWKTTITPVAVGSTLASTLANLRSP